MARAKSIGNKYHAWKEPYTNYIKVVKHLNRICVSTSLQINKQIIHIGSWWNTKATVLKLNLKSNSRWGCQRWTNGKSGDQKVSTTVKIELIYKRFHFSISAYFDQWQFCHTHEFTHFVRIACSFVLLCYTYTDLLWFHNEIQPYAMILLTIRWYHTPDDCITVALNNRHIFHGAHYFAFNENQVYSWLDSIH